jgi:hypothetical protein
MHPKPAALQWITCSAEQAALVFRTTELLVHRDLRRSLQYRVRAQGRAAVGEKMRLTAAGMRNSCALLCSREVQVACGAEIVASDPAHVPSLDSRGMRSAVEPLILQSLASPRTSPKLGG